MKKLVLAKRISQLFFIVLFTYILWATTYPLKSSISPKILFKLDPLVMLITSLSERLILAGMATCLIMFFLALILGRFFCGWVCPLGAIIDFSGMDNKGVVLNDKQNKPVRKTKFVILGLIFIFALLGLQIAWIFDPLVIAARFVSLNLIPAMTSAINGSFSRIIRTFNLYGPLYDFYRSLRNSFLGVKIYYFSHALVIFSFLLAVFIAGYKLKRSWCRVVCPLGAIYAMFSRFSLLQRRIKGCNRCMKCKSACRMGAIKDDLSYVKSECVVCLDCVYNCPQKITRFNFSGWAFPAKSKVESKSASAISRRQFLTLAFFSGLAAQVKLKEELWSSRPRRQKVIRPPAALKEEEFLNRCVRCGNCMKVCITNGLQPALFGAGLSGMWTPQLVPEVGYCEYHCTLCGNVCPTGAIPKLTEKEKLVTRLGLPKIDRNICIPWKKGEPCLVCEEHCPIPEKAIKLRKVIVNGKEVLRPYLNLKLCVGCGICQTKCPVRPERAIKVYPVRVTHGKAGSKAKGVT
ncbi:MAG: 4Fe-4S binding protein [Candidatus Omnitrophica bacterium]|nr:4Fe-4S binding protein [Candidatus Omnitrophota bacterium]